MSWFLRKLFRLPVCSLWVRSWLGVGVGSLGYEGDQCSSEKLIQFGKKHCSLLGEVIIGGCV